MRRLMFHFEDEKAFKSKMTVYHQVISQLKVPAIGTALFVKFVLSFVPPVTCFSHCSIRAFGKARTIMTVATQVNGLAQYAGDAAGLFNNMKTPASILAGAIVPIGFMGPLEIETPDETKESGFRKALRVLYTAVAVLSLCSELLTVIWATVASNQLTEASFAPAESVWALLNRDFKLEWAATNAHFVAGMWGFLFLIGTRVFFAASNSLLGKSLAGCALSGLMLMVAVMNRGVAAGSGDGLRYGKTVLALWTQYISLLMQRAFSSKSFGVFEAGAAIVFVASLQGIMRVCWQKIGKTEKAD